MEKRAQWWAMASKHWKRGAAAWSGGLGVARAALTAEVSVIALRLLSRPGFIPSQPECGGGSQRSLSFRAPLRTSLAAQHLHKHLPWPFSLLQRETFQEDQCVTSESWDEWDGAVGTCVGSLSSHTCADLKTIHSWCLFSCLPSSSQLPCPAHSILFMLPTQLASLGSQQGLWDHPQNPQLNSWVSLGISVSERFFLYIEKFAYECLLFN